jgi:hypothetical protein
MVAAALLVLGVALLLVGFVLLLRPRRHVRISNARGNVVVGDVTGQVSQSYAETGGPGPPAPSRIGLKEVIGWLLALPGAALAIAGLWKALSGG